MRGLLVGWILLSLSVFPMAWVLHRLHRDEKIRLRVALVKAVRVMQGDATLDVEKVIEEAERAAGPYLRAKKELGLSRRHHGELNRLHAPSSRYNELRQQYAGDSVAQQQIDVYDLTTVYHIHLRGYMSAIKAGDTETEAREADWFAEHYPDMCGEVEI